jgi:hypothetical protein
MPNRMLARGPISAGGFRTHSSSERVGDSVYARRVATTPKGKRIFISSTAEDLSEHRDKVAEGIARLDQSSIRMETFGARPNTPLAECRALAAQADALVVSPPPIFWTSSMRQDEL